MLVVLLAASLPIGQPFMQEAVAQGIDVPGAPDVGEKAPEFSSLDAEGRLFSLAEALAEKKVLLVFYRGFF